MLLQKQTTSNTGGLTVASQRYVKLNVGGRLFSTSLDTLTKQDNMLRAMFSGRLDVSTDADGYILIDRSGRHFEFLLNYLRDDDPMYVSAALADKSELELFEMLKEAKFYCMQPLVAMLEQKIMLNKAAASASEPYFGPSIVSMITSKHDLTRILNSTDKPCIRLLINRHNNKYSYTNTSDDNLLKNIELFERMAIKFKNRIMFIKDTTSNEEICCWYFHGGGKKLAEVCCTSIVYTTEKKQTKVEFPDSKILEEIFVNAVLFESKETQSNANNNPNSDTISSQIRYENGCLDVVAYDDDNDMIMMTTAMPRISLYQSGANNNNNSSATLAATVGPMSQTSTTTTMSTNPVGPVVGLNRELIAAAMSPVVQPVVPQQSQQQLMSSSTGVLNMSSQSRDNGAIGGGGASNLNSSLSNANHLVSVSNSSGTGRRGNR